MSEFKVHVSNLYYLADSIQPLESFFSQAADAVRAVKRDLRAQVRSRARIDSRLDCCARRLDDHARAAGRAAHTGRDAAQTYRDTEESILKWRFDPWNSSSDDPMGAGEGEAPTWWDQIVTWVENQLRPKNPTPVHIDSILFDDSGQYGGNQGAPQYATGRERQILYDTVRRYHPEYTDYEISNYLRKMNNEGCAYTASINTILAAYEGREAEFERTFGFPMYGSNGDLNYNRILVDFYAATDNHNQGLFGADTYDALEDVSSSERRSGWFNSRTDTTGQGMTVKDMQYRVELYLRQRGVSGKVTTDYYVTPQNFAEQAKNGYVVISYFYGNLQNADGSTAQYIDGGHAMVITGVTADGRYIVSSWGKKYYLDPNQMVTRGNKKTSYTYSYFQYN